MHSPLNTMIPSLPLQSRILLLAAVFLTPGVLATSPDTPRLVRRQSVIAATACSFGKDTCKGHNALYRPDDEKSMCEQCKKLQLLEHNTMAQQLQDNELRRLENAMEKATNPGVITNLMRWFGQHVPTEWTKSKTEKEQQDILTELNNLKEQYLTKKILGAGTTAFKNRIQMKEDIQSLMKRLGIRDPKIIQNDGSAMKNELGALREVEGDQDLSQLKDWENTLEKYLKRLNNVKCFKREHLELENCDGLTESQIKEYSDEFNCSPKELGQVLKKFRDLKKDIKERREELGLQSYEHYKLEVWEAQVRKTEDNARNADCYKPEHLQPNNCEKLKFHEIQEYSVVFGLVAEANKMSKGSKKHLATVLELFLKNYQELKQKTIQRRHELGMPSYEEDELKGWEIELGNDLATAAKAGCFKPEHLNPENFQSLTSDTLFNYCVAFGLLTSDDSDDAKMKGEKEGLLKLLQRSPVLEKYQKIKQRREQLGMPKLYTPTRRRCLAGRLLHYENYYSSGKDGHPPRYYD